jgi:integrase
MNDVSISFQVKEKSKNHWLIFIRLTQNRRSRLISTGKYVIKRKNFNANPTTFYRWVTNEIDAESINDYLKDIFRKYDKINSDLKLKNRATIENIMAKAEAAELSQSFIAFCENYISDLKADGRFASMKIAQNFLNKFNDFTAKRIKRKYCEVTFAEIDKSLVKEFANFLKRLPNKRIKASKQLLHPNSIAKTMRCFRKIVLQAIELGYINDYPFDGINCSEKIEDKKPLEMADIIALEKVKLTNSTLNDARNIFLFSYYSCGMRFGDCIQLRWANITDWRQINAAGLRHHCCYKMDKTGKSVTNILPAQAILILREYLKPDSKQSDYIFPLLSNSAKFAPYQDISIMPKELNLIRLRIISCANSRINSRLKEVAICAGINSKDDKGVVTVNKNVSMHIARHSYAYLMQSEGKSNNVIRETLGHGSLKTTERYMGGLPTSVTDNAVISFYENAEYQRNEAAEKAEALKLVDSLNAQQLKDLIDQLKK